jgi:hypothetical protein
MPMAGVSWAKKYGYQFQRKSLKYFIVSKFYLMLAVFFEIRK